MISIAIIGILISIAVPSFLRARENSRGQACQENLSKIDGAKEQYAIEFKLSNGSEMTMEWLVTPNGCSSGAGFLKREPECPSGGSYTIMNVGIDPTCSIGANNSPFLPHELP